MTRDGFALASLVILLVPMLYFQMTSLAFLLVRLDIPPVTRLLRGVFNAHFLIVSIAGALGTAAFLLAGRPLVALGMGAIAAFATWAHPRFLRQMDALLAARDAGDAGAVRGLRRMHWSSMIGNAIPLVALVASVPAVFGTGI